MPARECLDCHAALPLQKGRHQPRKYCTTCRPPRNRPKVVNVAPAEVVAQVVAQVAPRVTEIRPGAQTESLTLVAATTTRLAELSRLGTPEAVLVLSLARSIDDGGHSGASLASLSNAYARALTVATQDAQESDAADGVSWDVG